MEKFLSINWNILIVNQLIKFFITDTIVMQRHVQSYQIASVQFMK